jgi:hypothetical protein
VSQSFSSHEEYSDLVLSVAVTLQHTLQGNRNDVALSVLLVAAGATMEKFARIDAHTTPENVILLIALIREVLSDIAIYALTPDVRES